MSTSKFRVGGNRNNPAGLQVDRPSGKFGYTVGSGGAVTQTTSRTTGVTLNSPTGAITLLSAAGVTTVSSFTVTNSVVTAADVVVVHQATGANPYQVFASGVTSGSFKISFIGTTTATDQPVLNFAVIKGAAS